MPANGNELPNELLKQLNSKAEVGEKYYQARVLHPKDNTFKVINVYGEATGGATYNPFAVSYIIQGNQIIDSPISGEIFRIDVLPNQKYLLYVDAYWRLGSNFKVYETTFSDAALVGYPNEKRGNYLFDCIQYKRHSADSLPNGHPRKNDMDLLT